VSAGRSATAVRPAAPAPGPAAAGRRGMAVLTIGQAAGQTGSWAALVTALPLALGQPRPAIWLALINAAWAGPAMLSPLAGRPIDRYGPRLVGSLSWLAAAACAAGALLAGRLPGLLVLIGIISACRGAGVAAGDTAPTWLPRRPDLTRAGAWLILAAAVPIMAGALGAATLLAYAGPRAAWLAVAGVFAAGAACSALVPAARPAAIPGSEEDGSRRGPRRIRKRLTAILVVTAGVWLTYGTMAILQPLFVRQGLHASLITYGWTMVAFAIGSVALAMMAMTARPLRQVLASPWTLAIAAIMVAAGERLFTATSSVTIALAGAVVWGASAGAFNLACRSAVLQVVPAAAHGRALSSWRAVQAAANLAPTAAVGQLITFAGLATVLAGTCALAAAVGLACLAAFIAVRPRHPGSDPRG
jgi:MFS family permease